MFSTKFIYILILILKTNYQNDFFLLELKKYAFNPSIFQNCRFNFHYFNNIFDSTIDQIKTPLVINSINLVVLKC